MSNNHPSRGWRARMQNSCNQWLELARWLWLQPPIGHDETRDRLRTAYLAGYQDGRKRS
jgi:hypothetical protein